MVEVELNWTNFEFICIEFFEYLFTFQINRISNESSFWKFDSTLLLESNQTNQINFPRIFQIYFALLNQSNCKFSNQTFFERIPIWLHPYYMDKLTTTNLWTRYCVIPLLPARLACFQPTIVCRYHKCPKFAFWMMKTTHFAFKFITHCFWSSYIIAIIVILFKTIWNNCV